MRILFLLCLLPLPAVAQVTTDDSALKALQPAKPAAAAPPAPAAAPPAKPVPVHHATRHPPPKKLAPAPAKPPQVPAGPPPNPVILPPPPVLPVHPPPPPPPVTLDPAAPTRATPLAGGTRILFGPGSAVLNQPTADAITAIAVAAKADPLLEINVTAWAPGVAEDPSTPHRLSLDRALAARAVLIHAGIASERIHAIAKGFNDIAGAPPDRMDIIAIRPKSAPPGAPAPATTPPATAAGARHG
jgi:outer membrane protein OmpA-like peptidoglycan-associated protein